MEENIYFVVGMTEKVLNKSKKTIGKFFTVFEFTAGKVYFELVDEEKLEIYTQPIRVDQAKTFGVLDNLDDCLKQLDGYRGQLKISKDGDAMLESLEAEYKRLVDRYLDGVRPNLDEDLDGSK